MCVFKQKFITISIINRYTEKNNSYNVSDVDV